MAEKSGENGLGVAGFVTSLIGLFVCGGILSPVGMIMSGIAMKRDPKGLAIAGFVIGLVGTLLMLVMILLTVFLGFGFLLALVGLGTAAALYANQMDVRALADEVSMYQSRTGSYPQSLADIADLDAYYLTDQWGNTLEYELAPDGLSFTVTSSGEDQLPGTPDDISVTYPDDEFDLGGSEYGSP